MEKFLFQTNRGHWKRGGMHNDQEIIAGDHVLFLSSVNRPHLPLEPIADSGAFEVTSRTKAQASHPACIWRDAKRKGRAVRPATPSVNGQKRRVTF